MEDRSRSVVQPWHAALAVALASFLVYLRTMAPGVDWIDAGELTTDVYTLGIAHPTGYPLFTLVGYLFSHLPIASSVILRVNIMAAFFTALGAGAVVLLMHEISANWMSWTSVRNPDRNNAQSKKGKKVSIENKPSIIVVSDDESRISISLIAGITAGLVAAFSATWWGQSSSIEVYPLHLALVPLVLFAFLRMLRLDDPSRAGLTKNAIVFATLLGLSFSNHLTTVFLAPACLVLYFFNRGFRRVVFQQLLWLAIPFGAILLLYLYLPIRASMNPLMDWGHPSTLSAAFRHVTGGQYKIWMFTGSAGDQWSYFWQRAPKEFTVFGFASALFGICSIVATSGKKRWETLLFTTLLFFGCVVFAMNYGIHDIDSYFLVAYLATTLWIGCGVCYAAYLLRRNPRKLTIIFVAAALLLGFELSTNFADADESRNHMVDDYTLNMLRNLPPNAIIFSTQWDFWVSGAYYYQLVEKIRPDVILIDKAMLHDRNWYHRYLTQRAPEVMKKVEVEEAAFLKYLDAFDREEPFDQVAIGTTYTSFIEALVKRNLDRPIYLTTELLDDRDDPFVHEMRRIPAGVAWRLMPADTVLDVPLPKLTFRGREYPRRNYYTDNSRYFQAQPLAATAEALARAGKFEEAKKFVALALQFEPDPSPHAMEDLNERDRGVAESTNDRFARIESLKVQLQQTIVGSPSANTPPTK